MKLGYSAAYAEGWERTFGEPQRRLREQEEELFRKMRAAWTEHCDEASRLLERAFKRRR